MQLGLYRLEGGSVRLGSIVGKNEPVKARTSPKTPQCDAEVRGLNERAGIFEMTA